MALSHRQPVPPVDPHVLLCASEAYVSVCGLHHGCEITGLTTKYACLPNAGSCQLLAREACPYVSKSRAFYFSPSSCSLSLHTTLAIVIKVMLQSKSYSVLTVRRETLFAPGR